MTTQGADLLAKQQISITGNAVDLQAISDTQTSKSHSESKSVTVGATLSGTIGGRITAIGDAIEQGRQTDNKQLKGALALKAGFDVFKLAVRSVRAI